MAGRVQQLQVDYTLRQLSYLDEVSCTALQCYNFHIHNLASRLRLTSLTDEWLLDAMNAEWNKTPENQTHWAYVVGKVPGGHQEHERDVGHEGWTLEDFLRQSIAKQAKLCLAEIVGLRLYTGAGFKSINASCRQADADFAVTVWVCNRAIAKIAKNCKQSSPTTFYRGMKGRMRLPFVQAYGGHSSQELLGRLSDCGLFSTTNNLSVATGKYGGDILFVLSGCDEVAQEGAGIPGGYEMMCTPAPVRWISQYPTEDEFLWPTYTALIPKVREHRSGLRVDPSWPLTKHIYEFTPMYVWDQRLSCVGRWRGIDHSDLDMARTALRLAAHGLGMQDAYMSIPGLLLDHEIDEDFTPEQAVAVAFSVFDRDADGVVRWPEMEAVLRVFFEAAMSTPPGGEQDRRVQQIRREMQPLERDGGIHWEQFRDHFAAMSFTKF